MTNTQKRKKNNTQIIARSLISNLLSYFNKITHTHTHYPDPPLSSICKFHAIHIVISRIHSVMDTIAKEKKTKRTHNSTIIRSNIYCAVSLSAATSSTFRAHHHSRIGIESHNIQCTNDHISNSWQNTNTTSHHIPFAQRTARTGSGVAEITCAVIVNIQPSIIINPTRPTDRWPKHTHQPYTAKHQFFL